MTSLFEFLVGVVVFTALVEWLEWLWAKRAARNAYLQRREERNAAINLARSFEKPAAKGWQERRRREELSAIVKVNGKKLQQ